jgi:hypothetical protein
MISSNLSSPENIKKIVKIYEFVSKNYAKRFINLHNVDYIKMIKMEVDYTMLGEEREKALDAFNTFSQN